MTDNFSASFGKSVLPGEQPYYRERYYIERYI